MKKILLFLTILIKIGPASAQTVYMPNGANGIGTSSNANLGIGTPTPSQKLDVVGKIRFGLDAWEYADMYIQPSDVSETGYNSVWPDQHERALMIKPKAYLDQWGAGGIGIQFFTYDIAGGDWANYTGGWRRAMVIRKNGNVGIGTESPDAKLAVKGQIHTQEVRVDLLGAMVPDYVFEKDYDLLSLAKLEMYIIKNKHLPEIPSAKEIEANGLNLKEMNLLLLKKVEELTLYIINHQKDIDYLKYKVK